MLVTELGSLYIPVTGTASELWQVLCLAKSHGAFRKSHLLPNSQHPDNLTKCSLLSKRQAPKEPIRQKTKQVSLLSPDPKNYVVCEVEHPSIVHKTVFRSQANSGEGARKQEARIHSIPSKAISNRGNEPSRQSKVINQLSEWNMHI